MPTILLPKYGWRHQEAGSRYCHIEIGFRQTISGHTRSDRGFMVVVNRELKKILISFDTNSVDERHWEWLETVKERVPVGELNPQPYWGFDDLKNKAGTKLLNCFYVQAESKREGKKEFFHYKHLLVPQKFNFEKFLNALEEGFLLVDFDARTGHNHGTKFRLRQQRLPDLYEMVQQLV